MCTNLASGSENRRRLPRGDYGKQVASDAWAEFSQSLEHLTDSTLDVNNIFHPMVLELCARVHVDKNTCNLIISNSAFDVTGLVLKAATNGDILLSAKLRVPEKVITGVQTRYYNVGRIINNKRYKLDLPEMTSTTKAVTIEVMEAEQKGRFETIHMGKLSLCAHALVNNRFDGCSWREAEMITQPLVVTSDKQESIALIPPELQNDTSICSEEFCTRMQKDIVLLEMTGHLNSGQHVYVYNVGEIVPQFLSDNPTEALEASLEEPVNPPNNLHVVLINTAVTVAIVIVAILSNWME